MIKKELIKTGVSADNWREVVNIAGDLLIDNNYVEQEYVDSMIETVEDLGPYMILLPKLAFFHGKPSKAVKKVGLSLVVLKDSVYFEEFENQEIKCAFAFCAKDSDSHLEMLRKFSVLLANEKLIDLLTNNGNLDEILKLIEMENNNDL